jgi:hypothetical protein
MATESIGTLIPTAIPGYTDSADIQAALRAYHYGSYSYDPANTSPASLVSPSIAKTIYDIQADITSLENRPSSGGEVDPTEPAPGDFTPPQIPDGFIWVDSDGSTGNGPYSATSIFTNSAPTANLTTGVIWVDKDPTSITVNPFIPQTIIGAKGDIVVGTANDTASVLNAGTNGFVLSANSATTSGLEWVAQDDSNAIQNSIVDAKADLITATADNTPARIAVGANDTVLTADSSTATGLKWAAPSAGSSNVAGKNAILNSNFSVWQRGTSFTLGTTNTYTADRFLAVRQATVTGMAVSRQATGDTTNLPFIQYCARVQRELGNTTANDLYFGQSFESVNSIPFAGKTVTVSFYARAGANYSPTSSILNAKLTTGTGTDQNVITGSYTGSTNAINQNATLTTTWQRFTYTATLATTATELSVWFTMTPTGTAGANDYYEITGLQLEVAASASAYSPNTPTYQAELAACQRYYARFGGTEYNAIGTGVYVTATVCRIFIPMPVFMRTAPTLSNSAVSNFGIFNGSGNDQASGLSANSLDINSAALDITVTTRTAGNAGILNTRTNPTAFIAFSSEL